MVFLNSPKEHFEKLLRVAKRLEEKEVHVDDVDDFCKTAWHLVELVEKDAQFSREMRRSAKRLRSDPDIMLCEHAANISKHGKSRAEAEGRVTLSGIVVAEGYGAGRYGKGGWGVGEQSITLIFKDGTTRPILEFVHAVVKKWERVF